MGERQTPSPPTPILADLEEEHMGEEGGKSHRKSGRMKWSEEEGRKWDKLKGAAECHFELVAQWRRVRQRTARERTVKNSSGTANIWRQSTSVTGWCLLPLDAGSNNAQQQQLSRTKDKKAGEERIEQSEEEEEEAGGGKELEKNKIHANP
ncbi:hypothetical protein niasHT_023614 [Heterodera trifolii]|uniref:Uncharacterized protein n=1 Tax=Heterodera trifolii TaxID=157864 RepID=A0ABD2JKJ6_9BILA